MPDQINEPSKFHISAQILHGSALLSGKIYTAGKSFYTTAGRDKIQACIIGFVTNTK